MGYAYYVFEDGVERGYSIPDVCHHPGCAEEIDRGLSCLCYGCTQYFCDRHLYSYDEDEIGGTFECFAGNDGRVCAACLAEAEAESNQDDSPNPAPPEERR